MNDLAEIQEFLIQNLKAYTPPLQIRKDENQVFEVAGTKKTMQGKQKVDGVYFASVVPKPKDIRLYYFPIYTHSQEFENISSELKKCLKGKSCFHFKQLSVALQSEIQSLIQTGISIYLHHGLI